MPSDSKLSNPDAHLDRWDSWFRNIYVDRKFILLSVLVNDAIDAEGLYSVSELLFNLGRR